MGGGVAGGVDSAVYHAARELGAMPEGKPTTKAADEDAAHFLLRMVHKYPHQVTIYEGGPMTNLALAISIDPEFPSLAKGAGVHGRQPEPTDRKSRIYQHTPPRIQPLVRSGSGSHCTAGALGENCLHPSRYFRENENDQ